jgi:uncharacterized protein (TIGR02145 family)
MQDFTAAHCAAMSIGDVVTRPDARNGQEYRIRKMEDGKCWMIDNLRLELSHGMVLTPQDTDVATDTAVYFTKDGTANGEPLEGMTGNFTTSGNNVRIQGAPGDENYDAWRQNNPGIANNASYCHDGADLDTCLGYLYNFYTATAGTAPAASYSGPQTASGSICPAGWSLPIGGDDLNLNEFATLNGYMKGDGVPSFGSNSSYVANWDPSGRFSGAYAGFYSDQLNDEFGYATGALWSASELHHPRYAGNVVWYSYAIEFTNTDPHALRSNGHAVRCLINPQP